MSLGRKSSSVSRFSIYPIELFIYSFQNVVMIFVIIFIAMFVGSVKYFPHHLIVMQRRAVYYLWGGDEDRTGPVKYLVN